jgi:hypothetical protein
MKFHSTLVKMDIKKKNVGEDVAEKGNFTHCCWERKVV